MPFVGVVLLVGRIKSWRLRFEWWSMLELGSKSIFERQVLRLNEFLK